MALRLFVVRSCNSREKVYLNLCVLLALFNPDVSAMVVKWLKAYFEIAFSVTTVVITFSVITVVVTFSVTTVVITLATGKWAPTRLG
jgi:hypothetical protein